MKKIKSFTENKHKFKWPLKAKEPVMTLSEQQCNWLLKGIDIIQMQGHQPLTFESAR